MDFPIADLMDQDACYSKLLGLLHPAGLACPACKVSDHLRVHRRHRAPVIDYRCRGCGRVFNAFTGTALSGTHRPHAEVMLILRGFAHVTRNRVTPSERKKVMPPELLACYDRSWVVAFEILPGENRHAVGTTYVDPTRNRPPPPRRPGDLPRCP
jgi:hypothetical protein